MLLRVLPPPENTRHAQYTEQALAAILQANRSGLPIKLIYASDDQSRGQFCHVPDALVPLIEAQLYAWYPGLRLERLPDEHLTSPANLESYAAELVLTPEVFPAIRYGQLTDDLNRVSADPVGSILEMLPHPQQGPLRAAAEITLRPARPNRVKRAKRVLDNLAKPFFRRHGGWSNRYACWAMAAPWPIAFALDRLARRLPERTLPVTVDPLEQSATREHEREDVLQAASHKQAADLFEATLVVRVYAPPEHKEEAESCLVYLAGAFAALGSNRLARFRMRALRGSPQRWLASPEEIASLWHPPTEGVQASGSSRNDVRELEPPAIVMRLPDAEPRTILGEALYRGQAFRCGLTATQRMRHVFAAGMTGVGKTTLLKTMLRADFRSEAGTLVIDPHGDLIDELVSLVPRRRTNDVVIVDPTDIARPVSFNPLAVSDPLQRSLVADGVTASFAKLAGDAWGWRSAHYLRNSLLALLELPDATLVLLNRFLADRVFRDHVAARISNSAVRQMWQQEFAAKTKKQQAEELSAIQNKVAAFTSHELLSRMLGHPRGTLDLRRAMDTGQMVLVTLAKGRLGEDAATLLGSLLITSLQIAALQRADLPAVERRPFFVSIDEAPSFATSAYSTLLAEARKYAVGMTLVGQHLEQFDDATRASILGNCGTVASFSVGPNDAGTLSALLGAGLTPRDLVALPPHHAYVRLHGAPTQPFLMRTILERPGPGRQKPDVLKRTSQHHHGQQFPQVDHYSGRAISVAA